MTCRPGSGAARGAAGRMRCWERMSASRSRGGSGYGGWCAIGRGDYAPGRPIPSETRLMQEHGVARLTARKAVRVLADEGLVEVVRGRGAYVAERG